MNGVFSCALGPVSSNFSSTVIDGFPFVLHSGLLGFDQWTSTVAVARFGCVSLLLANVETGEQKTTPTSQMQLSRFINDVYDAKYAQDMLALAQLPAAH